MRMCFFNVAMYNLSSLNSKSWADFVFHIFTHDEHSVDGKRKLFAALM